MTIQPLRRGSPLPRKSFRNEITRLYSETGEFSLKAKLKVIWLFSVIIVLSTSSIYGEEVSPDSTRIIIAVSVDCPPKIDGSLDDPCWRLANKADGFIQYEPDEGKPATEETTVYLVYDHENIYFAFDCCDSNPEKIDARLVPRESGDMGDIVGISLDTYHDHRTAYRFITNPLGIQKDCHLSDDGASQDCKWDGIWRTEGKITERGWSVEIAIPFKTLRFPNLKEQVWGVNFSRYIKRKDESSFWAKVLRKDGWAKISRYGELRGLMNITPGKHIEVLPYIMGKGEKTENRKNAETAEMGCDLKWGITSNLTADYTINPDFAQVEADPERINLSKYELYFSEKRPFFMEGADLYACGSQENELSLSNPWYLFYSRRIGKKLLDGTEVNIRAGGKITGKLGRTNLGFLSALTDETLYNGGEDCEPKAHYTVLRIKEDIFTNSTLGLLLTSKDTRSGYARVSGGDFNLHFPKDFYLKGLIARSFNSGKENGWAGRADLVRQTENFTFIWGYNEIDRRCDVNAIGFAPQMGVKTYASGFGYHPQPKRWGIKQFWTFLAGGLWKENLYPGWGNGLSFNLNLNFLSEWWMGLGLNHSYSYEEGVGYRSNSYWTNLGSDWRLPIYGEVDYNQWDGYNYRKEYFGHFRWAYLWFSLKPRDNMSCQVSASNAREYTLDWTLAESNWIASQRFTYSLTRDLAFRILLQENTDVHFHSLNALLAWTFRPGSTLYLAYNELRDNSEGKMKLKDRIIFTKAFYLWSF